MTENSFKLNCFSLWNFKPDEKEDFPESFRKSNNKFFNSFKIVTPEDIKDCFEDFPELKKIWDRIPLWIVKSDIARLLYVYKHGGFYLDSDCLILNNIPMLDNRPIVVEELLLSHTFGLGPRECKDYCRRQRISNYAFGCSEPKNPFFKDCIDECLKRLEELEYKIKDRYDILWVCGPDVITSIFHTKSHETVLIKSSSFIKHLAVGSWSAP